MTSHRKNLLADPDFLARASAGDVLRDALNEPAFVKRAAVADSRGNDIADPGTFIADLKTMNYYTLVNKYGREVADNRSKLQRELEAQYAIRNTPRTSTEKVVDTGLDALKAVVGFGGGLAAAATGIAGAGDEIAFGDTNVSEISTRIAGITADVTDFLGRRQSDNLQDRSELIAIEGELDRQDSKDIMDQQIARGVSPTVANMERIGRDVLNTGERFYSDGVVGQSLIAGALGSAWPSSKLAKGGQILARKLVSRTRSKLAKKVALTAGSAAGIAIGEASGTYSDTSNFVMDLTEADMFNAPEYARLRFEGKEHEEAQRIVAVSIALEASARQLPVAAVLGLVAARFNANPIGVFKGKGLIGIYREAGIQVFEEAGQGASSVLSQNLAVSNQLNAEQDLFEGFGDALAEGGIAGLGMSGVLGAPSAAKSVVVSGIQGAVSAADLLKQAATGTIIDSQGIGRDAAGNARLKRKIKAGGAAVVSTAANTAGAVLSVAVKGGKAVASRVDRAIQSTVIDATGEGRDVARGKKPKNIIAEKAADAADAAANLAKKVAEKAEPVTAPVAKVAKKVASPIKRALSRAATRPNKESQATTRAASQEAVGLDPENKTLKAMVRVTDLLAKTRVEDFTARQVLGTAGAITSLRDNVNSWTPELKKLGLRMLGSTDMAAIEARLKTVDLSTIQTDDIVITPEVVSETLAVAQINPANVHPEVIGKILKHELSKDMTEEQISILELAAEIATILNTHRGKQIQITKDQKIGLTRRPDDEVRDDSSDEAPPSEGEVASRSLQIGGFTDARGKKLASINDLAADILEGAQSEKGTIRGDGEVSIPVKSVTNQFMMLVTHMRNKVDALNISIKVGGEVRFRSLVGGVKMLPADDLNGANPVQYHSNSPGSEANARRIHSDAVAAASVYNALLKKFPKLFTGGPIEISKLLPGDTKTATSTTPAIETASETTSTEATAKGDVDGKAVEEPKLFQATTEENNIIKKLNGEKDILKKEKKALRDAKDDAVEAGIKKGKLLTDAELDPFFDRIDAKKIEIDAKEAEIDRAFRAQKGVDAKQTPDTTAVEETSPEVSETGDDTTAGDEAISAQPQIEEEAEAPLDEGVEVGTNELLDGEDVFTTEESDDVKARNASETKTEEVSDPISQDETEKTEDTGPVTEKFDETFKDRGDEIGYKSGNDILNLLIVGTNTTQVYRDLAKKVFATMIKGMNARLRTIPISATDKRSPRTAILAGEKLSHIRDFKNTMLVDPKTGEYDPDLLSIAVVAMIDWMSSVRSADPSKKQLRKTLENLGVTLSNVTDEEMQNILHGVPPSFVAEQVSKTIIRMWNKKIDGKGQMVDARGAAEGLVKEMIEVMVDKFDFLELHDIPVHIHVNKGSKKKKEIKETTTPTLNVRGLKKIQKAIGLDGQNSVQKLLTPEENRGPSIGVKIKGVDKRNHRGTVNLSPTEMRSLKTQQDTPHRKAKGITSLIGALGFEIYADMSGWEDVEHLAKGHPLRNSIEGKNLSIQRDWDDAHAVTDQLQGENEDTPVYFRISITKVGRHQHTGINSQNNKTLRVMVSPSGDTLNMTKQDDIDGFWLTIAQASGLIKVENILHEQILADIQGEFAKEFGDAVALVETHITTGELNAADLFEATGQITMEQLNSIYAVADLNVQSRKTNALTEFHVTIGFELDGKTDGPSHMMNNFGQGLLTPQDYTNFQRVGLFLGQVGKTLNSFFNGGKEKDLYNITSFVGMTDLYSNMATAGPAVRDALYASARFAAAFGDFKINKADGLPEMTRNTIKNPMTKTVYGSGLRTVSEGIAEDMILEFYRQMITVPKGQKASEYLGYANLEADFALLFGGKFNPKTDWTKNKLDKKALDGFTDIVIEGIGGMIATAAKTVIGKPIQKVNDLLVFITNVQTEFLTLLYNKRLLELAEKLARDGTIGRVKLKTDPQDGSANSGKGIIRQIPVDDYKDMVRELNLYAPSYDNGVQILGLGAFAPQPSNQHMSSTMEGDLDMRSTMEQPVIAGVKVIPYLTQGRGDAMVVNTIFSEKGAPEDVMAVHDGFYVPIRKIKGYAKRFNEAVSKVWDRDVLGDVVVDFEGFIGKVGSDTDLFKAAMEKVNNYPQETSVKAKTANTLMRTLKEYHRQNQARKEVFKTIPKSVDHLAGAGEAFSTGEGEELDRTAINERISDKLNQKRVSRADSLTEEDDDDQGAGEHFRKLAADGMREAINKAAEKDNTQINLPEEKTETPDTRPIIAGKVEVVKRYSVRVVRLAKDTKVFVFGDNILGRGKKGQAVIRDEPNTVGIPTKHFPTNKDDAFFGKDVAEEKLAITDAINKIIEFRKSGKTIVFPEDGVGTGLARLEEKSPEVFAHLQSELRRAGLPSKAESKAPGVKKDGILITDTRTIMEELRTKSARLAIRQTIQILDVLLKEDNYKVIIATNAKKLAKVYDERNGQGATDLLGLLGSEGWVDTDNQIMYIVSNNHETLTHELIHLATFNKVRAHYEGTNTNSAVPRLETLMEEFLNTDFSEGHKALASAARSAKAAILVHKVDLSPVRKAAALNEFMAWSLTNAALVKELKVRNTSIVARMTKAAIILIRRILGNKIPSNMYTHILFNTLMLAPEFAASERQSEFNEKSIEGLKAADARDKAAGVSPFDGKPLNEKVEGAVQLPGDGPFVTKDQAKADKSNKFIGRGSSKSSTNRYAKAFGDKANTGNYVATDVVFVSAEGQRQGRLSPDVVELQKAMDAKVVIITDVKEHRARPFNLGERQVAEYLSKNGYHENVPGVWTSGKALNIISLPDQKGRKVDGAKTPAEEAAARGSEEFSPALVSETPPSAEQQKADKAILDRRDKAGNAAVVEETPGETVSERDKVSIDDLLDASDGVGNDGTGGNDNNDNGDGEVTPAANELTNFWIDQMKLRLDNLKVGDGDTRVARTDQFKRYRNAARNAVVKLDFGGFVMSPYQKQTFVAIHLVLATEMRLNTKSSIAMNKVFEYVTTNLTPEMFGSGKAGQERFATVMDLLGDTKNDEGVSDAMAVLLALSQTSKNFREALDQLPEPTTSKINDGTFNQYLTVVTGFLMNKALDTVETSGNNSKAMLDVLSENLLLQDVNKEFTLLRALMGSMNQADKYVSGAMNEVAERVGKFDRGIQSSDRTLLTKIISGSISMAANFLSNEQAADVGDLAKRLSHAGTALDNFVPFREFIVEVVGTDLTNAEVTALLDRTNKAVSNIRQQYKEEIPIILQDAFENHPDETQWTAALHVLAMSDFANIFDLANPERAFALLKDNNLLRSQTEAKEAEIVKAFPKKVSVIILEKSKQLASHMNLLGPGHQLWKNAYSINKQAGKYEESMTDTIDRLISLYALEVADQTQKDIISEMFENDREATMNLVSYMQALNKVEDQKTITETARLNGNKGWVPNHAAKNARIIIERDDKGDALLKTGWIRVGTYEAEVKWSTVPMGYYQTTVKQTGSYSQGVHQSVQGTYRGVNAVTGLSVSNQYSGIISGRAANAVTGFLNDGTGVVDDKVVLVPVPDETGILHYERYINPDVLLKYSKPRENLALMLGAWAGRQVEEMMAAQYNYELIVKLKEIYDARKAGEDNLFENMATSKDKVFQDTYAQLSPETRNMVTAIYGRNKGFMVKKDMVNLSLGYRDPSIMDLWTGDTRVPKLVQDVVKAAVDIIPGNRAVAVLSRTEEGVQSAVSTAKDLIVVRSLVVPYMNTQANVFQLLTRGVPVKVMKDGYTSHFIEIERFNVNEKQRIVLDTKIAFAGNNADKVAILKGQQELLLDENKRMGIWPLIEAGQYKNISEGITDLDVELTSGRISEWVENQVNKLPGTVQTVAKYGILSKDTAIYKMANKAVQYGDFLAKVIMYHHLVDTQGVDHVTAIKKINEEFINFSVLPGRSRAYLEGFGGTWFLSFKIRSMKIAMNIMRDNPVRALITMNTIGQFGSAMEDNLGNVIIERRFSYALGWDMLLNSYSLNPYVNMWEWMD